MADSDVREAPYALRVTERKGGRAAIIYRRYADPQRRDRLQRIAALAPLQYSAALPMLRQGVQASSAEPVRVLEPGPFYSLDADWGARVGCFALIASGLRDGERLLLAADNLRHADPIQASWWLGLLLQQDNLRALRALRILTEAVL